MLERNKISNNKLALYSRRDVAELLKIGISSLDAIPESELARVRLGKSIRFTSDSILKYIKSKESNSKGGD